MFEPVPEYFNFVHDVMDYWAAQRPDNLALWWVDEAGRNERKITFRELAGLYHRSCSFFASLGIRPGDRVLVILPRIPEWWTVVLGLIRLGAVPVPGPTLLTHRDIAYRIEAAGVRAVVTDDAGAPKVGGFDGIKVLVGSGQDGWIDFEAGMKRDVNGYKPKPTRSDEPGMMYFTSGTSGPPKMALHTQASYGLGHRITGQYWLDLKENDIHWALADTGWAKTAWSNLFGPWHMGACVFVVDIRGKFLPAHVLDILSHFPISTFCTPPTALRLIVHEDLAKWRFPKLRHCVAAGEALDAAALNKWRTATGLSIYEGYGQTECIVMVGNFRCLGHEIRPGSMGRPTPGFDLALLDEDLRVVPDGHAGQLAVRVKPHRPLPLFKEYWRNPEETAERFRGDWYLTGDMARRDAEGYFWFMGRADDVINSASYRIGPFEVESALAEHPAVLEAAVIGLPDKVRGEIVKAFVVLRDRNASSERLKRELQEHCKRITAPYKYPRQIEFVSEVPKTISGKIRRVELRAREREAQARP